MSYFLAVAQKIARLTLCGLLDDKLLCHVFRPQDNPVRILPEGGHVVSRQSGGITDETGLNFPGCHDCISKSQVGFPLERQGEGVCREPAVLAMVLVPMLRVAYVEKGAYHSTKTL